jgi:hypothetical protein
VTAAAWAIHLPTADETCVRVSLRPRGERDPWPFSLALTELAGLGAVGEGRFRALGSGHGEPLLASQELAWRGCAVHLETLVARDGSREAALALPSWDELCDQSDAGEDDFWELVDAFAGAMGAAHGAIVDGEPLDPSPLDAEAGAGWERLLDRHLALLVPEHVAAGLRGCRAVHYRDLPRSRLAVLLR